MNGDEALLQRIAEWLRAAVPVGVGVAVGRVGPFAPFDAREAAAVAQSVVRRREAFATGRHLARAALAGLGCPPCAIMPDGDGVPCWPSGFIGTISHSGRLCIALAAPGSASEGIGVDIELAARVLPSIRRLVCHPEESQCAVEYDVALCFSAKEAVFKARYPAMRKMLGFLDVQLEMSPIRERFVARIAGDGQPGQGAEARICGSSTRIGEHVLAVAWTRKDEC